MDEVLSINPSVNVFVFGGFNIHQKDWLTYSGRTDRPDEVCHNFSISNDLTQMVTFSTQIPDCDSHSTALLNFFLSSETSICSAMAFPPLGLHGRISLRSVLLLLLVNFMSGFRLELIYISLMENIRSSLTHLHVLQLLVLLL